MEYLKIKNWDRYQHYRDRNPPWIKLYNSLLDDYEYSCLQDASKLLLMSLFLVASKCENRIPADKSFIRSKSGIKGKIDFVPLIEAGFIHFDGNASEVLADRKQNGVPEKRREETEYNIYGQFDNVMLADEEYKKLLDKFGQQEANERIERLSEYIAAKGKKYKSHYATILTWERKDKTSRKDQGPGRDFRDYTTY